jgi:microcystin-dependent protein
MFGVDYFNGQDGANGLDALVDYDSLANLIGVDSSFIANVGSGMGGAGCDFNYPEGFHGTPITFSVNSSAYTVPTGKRLYVTGWVNNNSVINGIPVSLSDGQPLILNAGEILSSSGPSSAFNGYLVDETPNLTAITGTISFPVTYTVPIGKRLYVTGSSSGSLRINGLPALLSSGQPLILNAGEILNTGASEKGFNGYLVDENYFANCGVGGSSSATSSNNTYLDSLYVADLISTIVDSVYVNGFVDGQTESNLPIGVIQVFAGENSPNGWLFCDGGEISRSTYSDLFTEIGESYGPGDGSTTFNVPDLRGRVPVGKDNMGGVSAGILSNNGTVIGSDGGEENHIITIDEMPNHEHEIQYYRDGSYGSQSSANWNGITGDYTSDGPPEWVTNGNVRANGVGGDQPHNNMQPYLITNYIIKASGNASNGSESSSSNNIITTSPAFSLESLDLDDYDLGETIFDLSSNSSYIVSQGYNDESNESLLISQPSCSSLWLGDYIFYFEVTDTVCYNMPYSSKYTSNFGAGYASGSWSSYQCQPLEDFSNLYHVSGTSEYNPNTTSSVAYNNNYLFPGVGYVIKLNDYIGYGGQGAPAGASVSSFEFNSSFTNLSFWNKTTGGYQSSNYFPVLTGLGFNFSQPAKTLIPLNN